MSEEYKNMFIKFKISSNGYMVNSYIISNNREGLSDWTGEEPANEPVEEENVPQKTLEFTSLSEEFFGMYNSFTTSVPYMMRNIPNIIAIDTNRQIREYAKEHGELIDQDEKVESYQLPIHYIAEIEKRIDRLDAVASGLKTLPKLYFTGLISAFDIFFTKLIKTAINYQPKLIASSSTSISFDQLVLFGSIDAARNHIVSKEVEDLMRGSHSEQIEWLEKRLKIDLHSNEFYPKFIEICERRNLIIRTSGIVSSQYIAVCSSVGVDVSNISLGVNLDVNGKYYRDAVETLLIYGISILQIVWRKIIPKEADDANLEMNEIAYRLIVQRRYSLASKILKVGLHDLKKGGSERSRLQMLINHANAEKLSGNTEKANSILNSEDWTAKSEVFNVCVAAVKDDLKTVLSKMQAMSDDNEIGKYGFREWPVFEGIRAEAEFVEKFEKIFNEALFRNKEKSQTKTENLSGNIEQNTENN
jgi:hypothetical protein